MQKEIDSSLAYFLFSGNVCVNPNFLAEYFSPFPGNYLTFFNRKQTQEY